MMVMKLKKTKKAKKQRGNTRHGWGARKKHKGRGHRGGTGMAGTGKRADHKKTLITAKYGNKYFGKKGITSKSTGKKRIKKINLRDIERNPGKFVEKNGWLDLADYKILGEGELSKKIKIRALDISKKAKKIIEKAGGEVEVLKIVRVKKENIGNLKQDKIEKSSGDDQVSESKPEESEEGKPEPIEDTKTKEEKDGT